MIITENEILLDKVIGCAIEKTCLMKSKYKGFTTLLKEQALHVNIINGIVHIKHLNAKKVLLNQKASQTVIIKNVCIILRRVLCKSDCLLKHVRKIRGIYKVDTAYKG